MVVHPKTLWAAYGPTDGALTLEVQAVIRGLQSRPELNGEVAKILKWDGLAGRFAIVINGTGERILVKAVNLRPQANGADRPLCFSSSSHLGPLDVELDLAVASFLQSRSVGLLSTVSRALRGALWLRSDAEPLWESLVARNYGPMAMAAVRRACPAAAGPALYRRARGICHIFRETLEVVRGGVDKHADGFEVVACPTLSDPSEAPLIGAQGAVRSAAGIELENAIAAMSGLLPESSVTLVPGGAIAKRVALIVTAPPSSLSRGPGKMTVEGILEWLLNLHLRLLRAVRDAGYRSVVMPTLATGGVGVPPHIVAITAIQAVHRDLWEHPADPLWVRIACFEACHVPTFNSVKDELLRNFYRPEEAVGLLKSSLFERVADRAGAGRGSVA